MMGGNKLKERFLASDAFKKAYQQAYRDLYQKIYASGTALKALDQITATLTKVTGKDSAAIATDSSRLRSLIEQRTTALAQHEVITASATQ
jgi:spore coat protein CotH